MSDINPNQAASNNAEPSEAEMNNLKEIYRAARVLKYWENIRRPIDERDDLSYMERACVERVMDPLTFLLSKAYTNPHNVDNFERAEAAKELVESRIKPIYEAYQFAVDRDYESRTALVYKPNKEIELDKEIKKLQTALKDNDIEVIREDLLQKKSELKSFKDNYEKKINAELDSKEDQEQWMKEIDNKIKQKITEAKEQELKMRVEEERRKKRRELVQEQERKKAMEKQKSGTKVQQPVTQSGIGNTALFSEDANKAVHPAVAGSTKEGNAAQNAKKPATPKILTPTDNDYKHPGRKNR